MVSELLLEVCGIVKSFGCVYVFCGVDFMVNCVEVVVLIGDNGVGKSMFVKMLFGVYVLDVGEIVFEGVLVMLVLFEVVCELGIEIVY